MNIPRSIQKTTLLFIAALTLTVTAHAELEVDDLGLRYGVGSDDGDDFSSLELMAYLDPDWEWELSDSLVFEIAPEAAVGYLDGHGETAALVHIGLAGFLEIDGFPLSLVVSTGPTFLTEDEFGNFDIGGNWQFTSGLGVDWEPVEDWTVGYRYQHISNAGIESTNPGLNLHTFGVAYDF
jgi:Lipid A 3-O-deacylase (PagL).